MNNTKQLLLILGLVSCVLFLSCNRKNDTSGQPRNDTACCATVSEFNEEVNALLEKVVNGLFEEFFGESLGEFFEIVFKLLATEIERCADECKLEPLEVCLLYHVTKLQEDDRFSDVPNWWDDDMHSNDDASVEANTWLIDVHFTQSPSHEQLSYDFQSEILDFFTLKVTKSLVPGFDSQEASHTAVVSYREFSEAGEEIKTYTFTVELDKIVSQESGDEIFHI